MTLLHPSSHLPLLAPAAARRERRRLAQEDRRGAMLAGLVRVRDVLTGAEELVTAGWVQEAWYVARDASGREWAYGAAATAVPVESVTRSCLVGAVVLAAGGPEAAAAQPARRSIEALWHGLHRQVGEPVDWCPPAVIHAGHVHDLTRWNDSPRTFQADVTALLATGQEIVARERERALAG